MARDTEGITRDTLNTNKLSRVCMNVDETKTCRADSQEYTSFDMHSAQIVPIITPFSQNLTGLVVGAVIFGIKTLHERWKAPQPAMTNINR